MNFLRVQPQGAGLPVTRLLNRIRRLVRNADERDLRQLPASAQGIDAVRLMTMHGSKGLEFPVVHIPGLTKASIPRSPKSVLARDIIAPDGLIEGAGGKSLAAMHEAIAEEQECLFFVAVSRARDRLLLYSPTKTANGSNRARSPFIDRLGANVAKRHSIPVRTLPPDPVDSPVALSIDGDFRVTDHQLGLYQRCPRRFLYTHVLGVGGRRTETAFMLLHVAVQKVVEAVVSRVGPALPHAELEAVLDGLWDKHGPAEHGYASEYRRIASELLRSFADAAAGQQTHAVPRLLLGVAGGEIVIVPDQVVVDAGGKTTMRRVKTGHNVDEDENGLAAAAFHLAANAHTPGCAVEFVHLGDAVVSPVEMSSKVLGNRCNSIDEMVSDVRAGRFSLNETVTSPRCPAFFICGPVPAGPLAKKFSA